MSTMPGSSHKSPIDKLDTPCLVRVLQYVSPQQQLVVCGAVCSKWRKATREAISSICLRIRTQEKCDQLQQWLVHPPAALYTMCLHGMGYGQPLGLRLQLSVLQHLKELELDLDDVCLEAVAADGSVLQVADLLPKLQHCTKLTFHNCGQPELTASAAVLQAMPALQDLDLNCYDIPESLALPTTLTRLSLFYNEGYITTSSAAAISQLTGLRVLEAEALGIDTSVLVNCAGLERVVIDIRSPLRGEKGFAMPLLVFGSMPKLEQLQLQSDCDDPPVATAAEVAALSASSNLTHLSLGYSEYCALPPAAYGSWFPAGRHCPYLQHVVMGVGVLGNTAAVQRMASACPGLKELVLLSPTDQEMEDLESAQCVAASLQVLTGLTDLTRVRVGGRDLPEGSCISPAVIDAWSQWSNLQQLELDLKYNKLVDVLQLSQLRSLRTLSINPPTQGSSEDLSERLNIQARTSGPPDVWCQLPAAVWGAAIRRKQKQVQQRRQEQQNKQARATALLERQKAAQAEAASLSQQHAAAVGRVAALQYEHAAAQAKVAALQEQQAAEQAELAALLQKQQQAEAAALREQLQEQNREAAVLRQRLQEQQAAMAATSTQAEADRAQTALLQSQVSTLQATVTTLQATVAALLERQG